MTTPGPSTTRRRHIWGEVWRSCLAAVTGLLILVALGGDQQSLYATRWWPPVDVALIAVWLVLLHFRRRWPLPIAVTLSAVTVVSATAIGAMGIALVSLSTHRNRRHILAACVVSFAAGMGFEVLTDPQSTRGDWITNVVFTVLFLALCVATGLAVGARREVVAGLQARLQDAEREQVLREAQARIAERARIAREMHDVLAHRISLVVMHSGALAYRTNASADDVRHSSEIIRDNAQLALTELREVLGVLRDPDPAGAPPAAPQPTLAALRSMIEEARRMDGPITLTAPYSWNGLSENVSRNAFRIIQECVTNRRKHAPGSPITITLSHQADRLILECRNALNDKDAPESGIPVSGLGLVGLTERAVLSGGELTYGRDRAGDFVVKASLPWPRDHEP